MPVVPGYLVPVRVDLWESSPDPRSVGCVEPALSEETARRAFDEAAPRLRDEGHHVHLRKFKRGDELLGVVVVATDEAARRLLTFVDVEIPAKGNPDAAV